MNEREYRRLRALAEREYQEKIRALDLVWKMAQAQKQRPARVHTGRRGGLLAGIREVISVAQDNFTLRDIERWLHDNKPELTETKRASISSTLKRLVGDEVEVVKLGRGKRPTVYRRRDRGPG